MFYDKKNKCGRLYLFVYTVYAVVSRQILLGSYRGVPFGKQLETLGLIWPLLDREKEEVFSGIVIHSGKCLD